VDTPSPSTHLQQITREKYYDIRERRNHQQSSDGHDITAVTAILMKCVNDTDSKKEVLYKLLHNFKLLACE
jgi:hypothetical protein